MNITPILRLALLCFVASLHCSLLSSALYSQEVLSFSSLDISNKKRNTQYPLPDGAATISLEHRAIKKLSQQDLTGLNLRVDATHQWPLELQQVDLLSDEYSVQMIGTDARQHKAKADEMHFYQGHIKGNPSSYVSISISEGYFSAMINTQLEQYYIEPIIGNTTNTEQHYMIYDASGPGYILPMHCASDHNTVTPERINKQYGQVADCMEIELAIAIDYAYVSRYYHDAQLAINQSLHVMNMVSADFKHQFATDINFRVTEHVVSTCVTCDPWPVSTDAVLLLDEFSAWAQSGGFGSEHDLGQFLTGRNIHKDLNQSFVGYAHTGAACSKNQYHLLEGLSAADWKRRVICSHEIGHNLSCQHDPTGSSTIMSPTLTNSSSWSANSIQQIDQFLKKSTCISSCQDVACGTVQNIKLIALTDTSLEIEWDPAASGTYQLRLIELSSQKTILDRLTADTKMIIHENFSPCQEYELQLIHHCPSGNRSAVTQRLFHTSFDHQVTITDIETADCVPGQNSQYRLDIIIEHQARSGTPVYIDIDGKTYKKYFSFSPQRLSINLLTSAQRESIELAVYTVHRGIKSCVSTSRYLSPTANCDLYESENFNRCSIPSDWDITSSNQSYFTYPYDWSVGDHTRKILNYAKSNNEYSSLSIDGSCMAYFDDDIDSSQDYTGITTLYSPVYDISAFEDVSLELDYIFHSFADIKGENASYFKIEVWDGQVWHTILYEQENACPWSDTWDEACIQHMNVVLDKWRHDKLQFKFVYSDGDAGEWAGMVALDNILLSGERRSQVECQSDANCNTCSNGVMDGSETDIDCGGPDCTPCRVPCPTKKAVLYTVDAHTTYSNADTIVTAAIIDQAGVQLSPGSEAVLHPGFEVAPGYSFEVVISPCQN